MKETTGIIFETQVASPEACKAQKMAELKNLAEYRAGKLQKYVEWSKPEAIAARYAEHLAAAEAARQKAAEVLALIKKQEEASKLYEAEKMPQFKISPLIKTKLKIHWFKRLCQRIKSGFKSS